MSRIAHATSEAIDLIEYARALAVSRFDLDLALRHAERPLTITRAGEVRNAGRSPRVPEFLKAAQSAGTTSSPDWATSLYGYQVSADAFLESLRSIGVFDGMLASMVRIPAQTHVAVTTSTFTGSAVAEGAVKPISKLSLTRPGGLDPVKVSAMLVVTDALLRAPSAQLFAAELRNAVVAATDAAFLAGIVDSNTPSVTSVHDLLTDLALAMAQMRMHGRMRLFLIADAASVAALALLKAIDGSRAYPELTVDGGEIAGVQIIPSDAVVRATDGTATLLLVDASQIAADSQTLTFSPSAQATVQLDDSPTDPPTSGTPFTSLWQSDLRGLAAHRFFAYERLFDTAVVAIGDASYEAQS